MTDEAADTPDTAVTTVPKEQTPFERLGALESWPDWKLSHVLADLDVEGVKWSTLTPEQKGAVQTEVKRRRPQEESTAGAEGEGEEGEEGAVASPASPPKPPSPDLVAKLSNMTVGQAEALINKAKTAAELDELEDAEEAGKSRTGVFDAIAQRRGEIEP